MPPKKSSLSLPHQLHASCVSIGGQGVLILGESGSGKSDLCLRLIDSGAVLVADDRVVLEVDSMGRLMARAPERLRGLLEVRGLGVMSVPYEQQAPLSLVVESDTRPERVPDLDGQTVSLYGVSLPRLCLNLLHNSASAKVRLALATHLAAHMKSGIV